MEMPYEIYHWLSLLSRGGALIALIVAIVLPRFKSKGFLVAYLVSLNLRMSNLGGLSYEWSCLVRFIESIGVALLLVFIFNLKSVLREWLNLSRIQSLGNAERQAQVGMWNIPLSKILFSFQGRIGRGIFFVVWLSLMVVGLMARCLVPLIGKAGDIVLIIFIISFVWVGLALQVKRWQDLGRSGLMVLINLIPIIGLVIAFVWLSCIKGTTGANKYGNDPLQSPAA